jgi:hypothetical protein
MSDTNITTLIIALGLLIAAVMAFYFLRGKIKSAEVKAGGVSAKVGTHEPNRTNVKNVEQSTTEGSNNTTINSDNASVDGFKQTAKYNNDLTIGNS